MENFKLNFLIVYLAGKVKLCVSGLFVYLLQGLSQLGNLVYIVLLRKLCLVLRDNGGI